VALRAIRIRAMQNAFKRKHYSIRVGVGERITLKWISEKKIVFSLIRAGFGTFLTPTMGTLQMHSVPSSEFNSLVESNALEITINIITN
jgi:hypothetical protein